MDAEIGNAVGVIWRYLDRHGEATFAKLRHGTKLSDQLLLTGVGWLAKEGKISFGKEGRIQKIRLRAG